MHRKSSACERQRSQTMHQYKTGVTYEVTNKDFDSAWVEAKHHKSNVHLEHVFGAGMQVHVYSTVWLEQYIPASTCSS
jgi:hypothetical protein